LLAALRPVKGGTAGPRALLPGGDALPRGAARRTRRGRNAEALERLCLRYSAIQRTVWPPMTARAHSFWTFTAKTRVAAARLR
jgi:hypothetical protein